MKKWLFLAAACFAIQAVADPLAPFAPDPLISGPPIPGPPIPYSPVPNSPADPYYPDPPYPGSASYPGKAYMQSL